MPRPLLMVAIAALAALLGCAKRDPAQAQSAGERRDAAGVPEPTPTGPKPDPFVGSGNGEGPIGEPGAVTLIDAADDGSWVAVCQRAGGSVQPRVIVGDGPGLAVDRVVATGAHDLVVSAGGRLLHIDAAARGVRDVGPLGPAAIHGATRRIVHGRDEHLVIHDPGAPGPRELRAPDGVAIAAIALRHPRWAHVGLGKSDYPLTGVDCEPYVPPPDAFPRNETLDLDPSGVEAADRIGPTLGVTANGEITLDGAVVIDGECAANVVAALASPPRVLALCRNNRASVLAGPGFRRELRGYIEHAGNGDAIISPHLRLGRRVVCFTASCVDLLTGEQYRAGADLVAADDQLVIHKEGNGLHIDQVAADATTPAPPPRVIPLPRLVQAVTVDTVTGRRQAGAAPVPPRYIDRAGRWLLYGRYLIDVVDGVLVATLPDEPLAVDHTGRVLVPTAPGTGPLRWQQPR